MIHPSARHAGRQRNHWWPRPGWVPGRLLAPDWLYRWTTEDVAPLG